ncbi:MAG: hypothetical protein HZB50_08605 [Chloroflexi bacterium]|nr:hypothetical protein [Chloroflexota bacterium]
MMQIHFERTGGFMGRNIALDLDLSSLPPDQAAALKLLVDESDFFNLTELRPENPMPDGFVYSITVETETNKHTIHASELKFPQRLRPLLNDLLSRTRTR